ncbi:MAG TPA: ABC transporter ATP-binding protein [Alphaproteobacteria bacterium]|nr:ABC transporter ATP-binding protein [Alphaproteobacteria bacterium]
MTALEVRDLTKSFGKIRALDDVSFTVPTGGFFTIVGPTNAGKSTLLKTIAGLHEPDRGEIIISGRRVNGLEPRLRRVSMLFQNIALFPQLSGFENIAFSLRAAKASESEISQRVGWAARLLGIEPILNRLPRTFSGGEQQRVAIGRAIVQSADLLLLDEPLTNLDARIRIGLRIAFKQLHHELGQAIVYVTHDQVEAMSLSDSVGVLNSGRFEQIGSPDEVYHRPATRFVARFIGTPPMNFIPAELGSEKGEPALIGKNFSIGVPELRRLERVPDRIELGIRPESIEVAPEPGPATPFPVEVKWIERLGARSVVELALGGVAVKAALPTGQVELETGAAWCGFRPQSHHILDSQTGRFLR